MPYMYILECADNSYYTGSTWNIEKRFSEHQNAMGANYTSKRLPVKLIYLEYFERIENAFKREKQIQGWTHAKKKALIESNDNELHRLAECKNNTHWSLRRTSTYFDSLRLRSVQAAKDESFSDRGRNKMTGSINWGLDNENKK